MANYELNVKINGVEQSVSSIGELEKALTETNVELTKIDKNSKSFAALNTQAEAVNSTFQDIAGESSTVATNLNKVNQQANNLGNAVRTGAQLASELQNAGQSTTNLNGSMVAAATSATSLRTELRNTILELQNLEPGSARFQELSVRAGELRDQISDTNATVTALAGNTTERLGGALQGTVQIGIAGFQGVAAAQALFGVKSEEAAETMVKLQALLNLSQAVQSFGGLKDQVTNIIAGFKSLIPTATTAAATTTTVAAAEGAAGVAATGAAAGTTAFSVALNSLPLVAIVTALGLLVAGMINYFNTSDQAEEAEKARNEELKKQEEQIKSVTDATAKEGSELFVLLNRLKQTNAGSKERADLIRQINADYGLTLKNLRDEKSFQDQVTKSVEDYIAQLKNKVALQLVEQELTTLLTERLDIERQLTDQTQKYNTANTFFRKTIVDTIPELNTFNNGIALQDGYLADLTAQKFNNIRATNAQFEADANSAKQSIASLEARRKSIDAQVQDLATEAQNYEKLLSGAFEKINTGSTSTGKSLEDLKAKQEQVNRESLDFTEFAATKEIELQKLRVQTTADKLDDITFETAQELAEGQQRYEAQKLNIEKNVKDEKTKIELLKTLNSDYQRYLTSQSEITALRENEINQKRLQDSQKLYAELALANEILQNEVRFAGADTTDSLILLQNRLLNIQLSNIEKQLQAEELSVEEFNKLQDQKLEIQKKYNDNAKADAERQSKAQAQVELATTIQTLEEQLGATVEFNKETNKYEIKSTDEKYAEFAKLGKVALDDRIAAETLAEQVINKTAINLNEEANIKIQESDQSYIDANVAAEKAAEDEKANYKIKKAQDVLQIIQQFADAAIAINDLVNQSENQQLTQQNEARAQSTQNQIDSSYAALEQELAQSNLTEEQKQERRAALQKQNENLVKTSNAVIDAENRKLAKKQFDRQKALSIVSALINGAGAVLQGIAQFGPPPSPLGIASIVAAGIITAAQVAAIASQQFDGGSSGRGTGMNASIPDTSTTSSTQAAALTQTASTGGFTSFNQSAMGTPTNTAGTTGFTSGSQRVYVLESDITSTQDRVRVLESNSTFG